MKEVRRPRVTLPWKSGNWRTAVVLGALRAMHNKTCAYCQSGLYRSDGGDVDHFRPQEHYEWLSDEFENYFLSCGRCNRGLKRNAFPLRDGATRARQHADLDGEKRLLIDPGKDAVESWYWVDHEDELCPLRLREDSAIHVEARERFKFTRALYELNDDVELCLDRFKQVDAALRIVRRAVRGEKLDADDVEEVRRLASRYEPHGVIVRIVLEELAAGPAVKALLPKPRHELEWFVVQLVGELRKNDRVLARAKRGSLRRKIRKRRRVICWALAVLWFDPPAATREEVVRWIEHFDYESEVRRFYVKLSAPE